MSKKKTHEEYVAELAVKNPNIEAVEEYMGANTKILHKCLIDGFEWDATPHNILKGRGCPKCGRNIKKTHEEYIKEVSDINPNIEVVGKYVNLITPILHKCVIHNIEWHITPGNVLRGHGCKQCANDNMSKLKRKNYEQYVEELNNINPNIEVIGEYITAHTSILHRCVIDGFEWYAKPNNILSGKGCPKCKESYGEKSVCMWLDAHNIKYEREKIFKDCKDKNPLPFDFYLPAYHASIEYQGEQHYRSVDYFGGESAFALRVKHDEIKKEYCNKNNIKLLCIPYYENVEKQLNDFLFI